jgi:hypothetical protein
MSKSVVAAMVGSNKIPHGPLRALLTNLHKIQLQIFFFFFLRRVSGPAYAHHDYFPRSTGHPASPGAGKVPRE